VQETQLNSQVTKKDVDKWADDLLTRMLLAADQNRRVEGNVIHVRPIEERS
jgi:hypothetical protein